MFTIKFTADAVDDLQTFSRSEQRRILAVLESELTKDPAIESAQRKPLQVEGLSAWQVRFGFTRVFYAIDMTNHTVRIEAVGKRFSL
jgi:mRNA-degrading endonuclease RelE of RelBE toxin-antitoxin system